MRTTRAKTQVIYSSSEKFAIGGSKTLKLSEHDVVTVVAAGITLFEALKAYAILSKEGVFIRVIDLYSIKPLDVETLKKTARETKAIITVEDHYAEGGIGEAVASALAPFGAVVHRLAVSKMPHSGSPNELLMHEEIDAAAIVQKVKNIL
jgi:transketolase